MRTMLHFLGFDAFQINLKLKVFIFYIKKICNVSIFKNFYGVVIDGKDNHSLYMYDLITFRNVYSLIF